MNLLQSEPAPAVADRTTRRQRLTTAAEVVGAVVVAVGAGLAYMPAGVISGGVVLVGVGVLEGRK